MTLDAEQLNIPATTYSSQVVLPSHDFSRTCKELSQLSENGKFREYSFVFENRETFEHSDTLLYLKRVAPIPRSQPYL